jgi:hypothetical protein
MSPLPQRRKSPDEIAKLRESLGVPGSEKTAQSTTVDPTEQSPPPAAADPEPPLQLNERAPKPVRSLRKSERKPGTGIARLESPPDSSLPHCRHSNDEIEQIRRREMLQMMNTTPNRRLFPAHPALIAPGYLTTAIAAGGIWFYQIPLWATAAGVALALSIASCIVLLHPVSRHHAAFIAVLAFLLLAFSALHYFPHLRHAT